MMASKLVIGFLTVFIATFMLFFIFDNINSTAKRCRMEGGKSLICKQLSGFTLTVIVLLLIIGGFFFVILMTAYILLTS